MADDWVKMLSCIFIGIKETEIVPEEWIESILATIYKRNSGLQKLYSIIALMAHTLKMCERVIERKPTEGVWISDQKLGFIYARRQHHRRHVCIAVADEEICCLLKGRKKRAALHLHRPGEGLRQIAEARAMELPKTDGDWGKIYPTGPGHVRQLYCKI